MGLTTHTHTQKSPRKMAKKTSKKKTHQDRHTHSHKQLPNAHVYKFLCSFSCFLLASFVASAPLALAIQFSYNFRGCSRYQHSHALALIPPLSLSLFLSLSTWQIVRPVNAFLIVDVQNDFISGSLDISNCTAQQQGHEVSPPAGVATGAGSGQPS